MQTAVPAYRLLRGYPELMRLLETLANAFINTFGITQPTNETRRRASWFILSLLLFAVFLAVASGVAVYHFMNH